MKAPFTPHRLLRPFNKLSRNPPPHLDRARPEDRGRPRTFGLDSAKRRGRPAWCLSALPLCEPSGRPGPERGLAPARLLARGFGHRRPGAGQTQRRDADSASLPPSARRSPSRSRPAVQTSTPASAETSVLSTKSVVWLLTSSTSRGPEQFWPAETSFPSRFIKVSSRTGRIEPSMPLARRASRLLGPRSTPGPKLPDRR